MELFDDPLQDEFAAWATGYITCGGADFGELVALADSFTGQTDDGAFYELWTAAGDRHVTAAADAIDKAHPATACGHELRATTCYGVGIRPLYGTPVDGRFISGFDRQQAAFQRAVALLPRPGEALDVQFDGRRLPAYLVPAADSTRGEPRPLLIATNGYDSNVADMYLAMARATVERGYHCVVFDGPGQGAPLVHDGVAMVPEWDRVVSAVVDAVIDRPDVDAAKIALYGWSLGGQLAARAAAGEHRLAACVLDPPLWGVLDGVVGMMSSLGLGHAAAELPAISDEDAATVTDHIVGNRSLNWKVVQRGYWVNGATDLRSYLAAVAPFTMDGRAGDIRCPVLGTAAEQDPLAKGAEPFLAKLSCPTTLLRFSAQDGAGAHCEMQNRWQVTQRILDWLDETL